MTGRLRDAAGGWRLALRIGRREARRARWRSLLVIAMIALPVAGVTAIAVTYKTYDVNTVEGLDRRIGTEAAARVEARSPGLVRQGIDPDQATQWVDETGTGPLDAAGLRAAVGDRPMLSFDDYGLDVRTDKGVAWASALRTDLSDPLAAGLTRLIDGRLPQGSDEVVVNAALAARGPGPGEELRIPNGGSEEVRKVVGIVESAEVRNEAFVAGAGLPGTSSASASTWLVGGGPVTWDDVEKLNSKGAFVLSRSVVQDPSAEALAADRKLRSAEPARDASETVVLVLIVVMVLLEVVLLAGPAFAVAARRQARDLALISASGGTARQARRAVLGMAIVIGAVAAVVGAVLGIGLARLLQPLAQDQVSAWFGPFEVPWLQILAIAAIGFGAAICAAIVPAWIASRQNVVGVLSGRRSESRPSRRSPVIGLALVVAGAAASAYGTRGSYDGIPIALGVLLCVAGLLLILPVLVSMAARFSARMPLVIRFATRDADRHRTRTVPAAGAIAVTVVGAVTLGVAFASDQEQNQATYQPLFAYGDAAVRVDASVSSIENPDAQVWQGAAAQVEKAIPKARVAPISAAVFADPETYFTIRTGDGADITPGAGNGTFGEILVAESDGTLPPAVTRVLEEADAAAAEKTVRAGGVVVFVDDGVPASKEARVDVGKWDEETQSEREQASVTVPATYLHAEDTYAPAYAVVSPAVVKEVGAEARVSGLYVEDARITAAAEQDLAEVLAAGQVPTSIMVERGFQQDDEAVIVWLLLITLSAVLMIGGALTATYLALNDARPDLATLSAVGAPTRTRRGVAAAYALVIALLGAIPGALIGFVPGVAVSFPLTAESWPERDSVAAHYLDVPWDLVGVVVVGLPLLIALIVAVTTRSRLPMVARVE